MDWVKFQLALWYRATRGLTDSEKGALMDKTVDALVDELAGVSPIADKLLEAEKASLEMSREMGRRGGRKKAENAAKRRLAESSTPTSENLPPLENALPMGRKSLPPLEQPFPLVSPSPTPPPPIIPQQPTFVGIAHTREEAGATPAPPANEQGEPCTRLPSSSPALSPDITANLAPGLAERLAEAMKGAPLSVTEALDYATGPHCGLTPAQVLDWADWNSEKQWARDSGGNLHTLTADGARASMRRWKNRQPEIERWRKARESRTGGAAGGDVTIRGVRVSSKGGVPDLEI